MTSEIIRSDLLPHGVLYHHAEELVAACSQYESVFGTDGPPSTSLGAAALGSRQLVEIEAVAMRDRPGLETEPANA